MPRVAAVIVTHNRKEKLLRCIEAVLMQDSEVLPDIFIVDNGSSDGTGEEVSKLLPKAPGRIIYSNLRHNSGGAGGFCYGIRKATEAGYDFIWLMDDDCRPDPAALREFLRCDKSLDGNYGFLSGRAYWTDGSLCKMNIQRRSLTRKVSEHESGIIEIETATFVSLFLPRKAVLEAGLPFREFFIWSDDWEYTRRISGRYPCYLVTDSTVVHDMEANVAADIATAPDYYLDRFKYRYRNDVYLYRREGVKGIAYEAAKLMLHLMRIACADRSINEKVSRAQVMFRGTVEGLSFYPMPDRAAVTSGQNEPIREDIADG